MNLVNFIFLAFSAITLLCALMVVFAKSPIHSILYLILTMFSLSGHYILLHAQFIGVVNIIVYAGAIMVLFLFVLMLLNLNRDNEPNQSLKWKLIGIVVGILSLLALLMTYKVQITKDSVVGAALPEDFGYVKPLGQMLFTNYVFPFEISSILFIAAMVGVVFIGNKEKTTEKLTTDN